MTKKLTKTEKEAFAAFEKEYALQANPDNSSDLGYSIDYSDLELLYENETVWIVLNADEWVNVIWKDGEHRIETIEL